MNSSVYLFGRLIQGYTQYPNDHTQSIFQNFASKATVPTQIVIHRENNLMYYGYMRLMDVKQSQYLGMCIVFNDLMIRDIESLFDLFENTFTSIVANGDILKLDENGNVVSNVAQVNEQLYETHRVLELLQNSISSLDEKCTKLPPVSYEISSSEVKRFTIKDSLKEIIEASYKYGYTVVYKNSNYETNTLKGYKSVIKRLKNEKDELDKNLQKLSVEYKKVLKEKKRSTLVSLLSVCMVFFLTIGFVVIRQKDNEIMEKNTTLSKKETELDEAKETAKEFKQRNVEKDKIISEQKVLVWKKDNVIDILNDSIYNINLQLANQTIEISNLRNAVSRLKERLRSEERKNSQLTNNNSNNQKSHVESGNYVEIYNSTPLYEAPDLDARVIDRMHDRVLILYKENERFYRVRYGNIYGYLWKEWIR